nr:unnamed protein product [Spirometra erinaceieuropaei]
MQIRLEPRRRTQGKRPPGELITTLLSLPANHFDLSDELAQRLANLPTTAGENASAENRWYQLRATVQSTALAALGHAGRQHRDWFNENDAAVISRLLAEEDRLHKAYVSRSTDENKAAFYRSRCLVQRRLRGMQTA